MKIALITDAWKPQVNGVVRTLMTVTNHLRARGHQVEIVAPDQYRSIPCPSYSEIRLALVGPRRLGKRLEAMQPDAVHIATEGPLGWAARRWCLKTGRDFTTAYHTQFPDYVARRTGLPASLFWPVIRKFHQPSVNVMVATQTIRTQLREQGLTHLREWSRGVDVDLFTPDHAPPDVYLSLPRPIQLYVGRVAVEKNIEAFLSNSHPGSKVVVGDGPAIQKLKSQFPDAHFLGKRTGTELAACYAGADVFVFPSKTDTFGLVMIEALACGTPVAAFPVAGPLDVLDPKAGVMDENLELAIAQALTLKREDCLTHGQSYSWESSTDQFLAALSVLDRPAGEISLTPATA